MQPRSILLAVDGSEYSRNAAELSWVLAKETGAHVLAQHVVDLKNAWSFIGQTNPGFLDKQDYENEFQKLSVSLWSLAERLGRSYSQASEAADVHPHIVIDEGDPYQKICERALETDMVIVGHRPFSEEIEDRLRRGVHRLSIAESLAHGCPRPLLVVQSTPIEWASMTILCSMEHLNTQYINETIEFADTLGLQPAVVCLSTGLREEPYDSLISDLRSSSQLLEDVPIAITSIKDSVLPEEPTYWDNPIGSQEWDDWAHTLVVLPTRELAGRRLTVVGSSPSMFVRFTPLPAMLFWPEDRPHLIRNPLAEETLVTG